MLLLWMRLGGSSSIAESSFPIKAAYQQNIMRDIPPIEELAMVSLGTRGRKPYLLARVEDEFVIYECFPFYPASPIPSHLNIRWVDNGDTDDIGVDDAARKLICDIIDPLINIVPQNKKLSIRHTHQYTNIHIFLSYVWYTIYTHSDCEGDFYHMVRF